MDLPEAPGSVFMCRLCNLFSPSHTQLSAHCSQLHPEQTFDDIIIVLQPLAGEPLETPQVSPLKRKRGRPKGSKKKKTEQKESKADSAQSRKDNGQSHEDMNKEEDGRQCSLIKAESQDGSLALECRSCHRSFRNRRQILKHICLGEVEEENDEENGKISDDAGVKGYGNLGPGGTDSNQTQQKSARRGFISKKEHSNLKTLKTSQSSISREGSLSTGNKKSVVSVVLTEEATIPGVFKLVPLEERTAETDVPSIHLQDQSQSAEPASNVNIHEAGTEMDLKSSNDVTCTKVTTTAANKGFSEYSIQQHATNFIHSQLKIFACEFCNKIFKFRHSLVAHLRTHTQEKPFQCPHCDYASGIKANLNVHLRKHTGEKFSCQHCPFKCLSPGHLKVHIQRVHLKVKQHCGFCDKKYSDVKNLLKHMEKQHNLKDPDVNQSYQKLRLKTRQGLRQLLYHCPTCNRGFKNQLERERHLLVHAPHRPFACLLCDHAATKMEALAAHVKKHLFIYVCYMCEGKFVSSQGMTAHLKESHTEQDQDQAFTRCINNSYYLMQPGENIWGNEEREDARNRIKECNTELKGGDDGRVEEDGTLKLESGVENGGTKSLSQEMEQHRVSSETQVTVLPADKCSNASTTSKTAVSLGVSNISSAPLTEEQTQQKEKSAFQQVFASLPKTQLNMESFQQLRKIYGDLECQYCGKLFWYKVHYNVHVRTHTKEHSHYCSKCSYSSITKSSLKRHQIQKHSGLQLSCSSAGCKYTTPDKYKLQAHLRMHQHQGKNVACPICQNSYPEHRLKCHIKTTHPDALPIQAKGVMVKRAEKCPYCDSYFLKNSSDYQRHIWAHQGLKPYACTMCDYAGRSRSNLKTHMNRHNTERCHLCDLCGKKFKSKVTLKSHRLSHTEEGKQFQCLQCDFNTVSKPYLLRHMEQHAEFKPFRCAHCHYSCNIAGPLKRHYKKKHPGQKYHNVGPGRPNPDSLEQHGGMKCPQCEFVYGTKWELNRHLKSKHNLKVMEGSWEVGETVEAQYNAVEDGQQLMEATEVTLQDNVNIQQITELSAETYDAVTSMVAMAPGTVTVVQQLQMAEEQEVNNSGNQLMVVNEESSLTGNQVMVVNEDGGLASNQVMVVEDGHGLEALTVLTQDENTHHYIVYVQEHTVEIN
ncbi:zinc finger protein ZFAT isoform X1 [Takifugu rubripes]|uniref:Zinc finger and AT hook domain containing n=1 Tax=Takifugu rubripes TaxID=31033 RepID=H2TQV3_TAKRU|nr:zinc finger protein ZFAT isoform X1 [Takifugu rubripes]|eukprot:XP_011603794.1 PREDICTED: zinc finger protein ZFAT isoform X3 [Takifugu rubripes]